MKQATRSWRSARSAMHQGVDSVPQAITPWPEATTAVEPVPVALDRANGMPWQNVGWSVSLIGLLGYIWAVTTYAVPIGQASMIVAIVGLAMQRESLRFPPFLWIFAAYLGWAFVGASMTDYPRQVSLRIELLWKVGLIALVAVNALRTRAQQRLFMFVFLGAFALYPTRGALFNYFGGYTVFGRAIWNYIYANPNDLAALTLLQLGMALAVYVREPKGWPKLAAMAGIVVLPFVVLLTQSRGAFLAIAAFGLLLIAGQRRRFRTLAIVAIVGAVVAMAAPDSLWDRVGGLRNATSADTMREVDEEGSAEQRYEIWKVARKIARENLIVGVGVGAYSQAHARYSLDSEFKPTARGARDTHSTYLNVLAESGTVGLFLFLALFANVFFYAERVRRRIRGALPASGQQILYLELGLLAFLMAGIFGSFAGLAFTYVQIALLWTVTNTIEHDYGTTSGLPASRTS